MAINRRQFLLGAGGLAAAATTGGLTACAPGSVGGGGGGGGGGRRRNDPGSGLVEQPDAQQEHRGDDRCVHEGQPQCEDHAPAGRVRQLLGQAGHPDRRRHGSGHHPDGHGLHLRVRQSRRALDLEQVDTSKFVEGTVDSGKINDKLVGVNAGINSSVIFANPNVFEKAKMDIPDDTTWTWDSMMEVGCRGRVQGGSALRPGVRCGLRPDVRHVGAPARQGTLQSGRARV